MSGPQHTGQRAGASGPSRRELLRLAGACALWPAVGPLASGVRPAGAADRRLVLLDLEGGNDGLNTVVPFGQDAYQRARPRLGLSRDEVARLDDEVGLHPSLEPWRRLFDAGRLAIVEGVGTTQPERSHFVSRDLWACGRDVLPDRPRGWVGRALDHADPARLPAVALGADEAVLTLRGERHDGLTVSDPGRLILPREGRAGWEAAAATCAGGGLAGRIGRLATATYGLADRLATVLEAVPPSGSYPDTRLGEQLGLAARLVRAEGGPPVVFTSLGGFDTHAVQAGTHAALLNQLAQATSAFADDLARDGSDGRTLLLIHSEFGRRVAENGSGGTDHGAAAPVFALGGGLTPGFHGQRPDLDQLLDGDLRVGVGHRALLAEVARWMGWDVAALFGEEPAPVGLLGG